MKTMKDVWDSIKNEYGEEGLFDANSAMIEPAEALSTGSYALDDALGIWGIAKGSIIHFAGPQSSGKSLLSLIVIAEYQKKNPSAWCYYNDAEFSFDTKWSKNLGVDLERLKIYKENRGVQIFERLVGRARKAGTGKVQSDGKMKMGILDLEKQYGGTGLGLIVIDSIASIQPPIELDAEVGKQNMAPLARFLPAELRRITPLLAETGVTLIAINHLRTKPGAMYGDPTDSPGGTALKHSCAQMLSFTAISGKDSNIERNGEKVGHHIRVKITKNKKAEPYKVAEFAIEYTKGIVNKNIEAVNLGVKYGVVKRPNNRTFEFEGQKYSKEEIYKLLEDEETQHKVIGLVKEAKANGTIAIEENQGEEENEESI